VKYRHDQLAHLTPVKLRRGHSGSPLRVGPLAPDEIREGRNELQEQINTVVPTRATVAATLREWHTSLAIAATSEEAEVYACAVALIVDALTRRTTMQALVDAYYFPDLLLRYLVLDFCANGKIRLRPRLVMGAACALRLRQLVAEVAA
jgi:hypothetical protein